MPTGSNLISRPDASELFGEDLLAIEGLTTTVFGRSLLTLDDAAALRVASDAVIGTHVQAHDTDLDAIAVLATTVYGRALLTLADLAALYTVLAVDTDGTLAANSDARLASQKAVRTAIDALAGAAAAAYQPLDSDLTAIAALNTTAFGQGLLELANAAALWTAVGTVPAANMPTQAAIADVAGTSLVLLGDVIAILNDTRIKFNLLLGELRTAGLIAP